MDITNVLVTIGSLLGIAIIAVLAIAPTVLDLLAERDESRDADIVQFPRPRTQHHHRHAA